MVKPDANDYVDYMRDNGKIVIQALGELNKPVNMKEVVSHIAESHDLDEKEIKAPIHDVLKTSYTYGFINKAGTKYFVGEEPPTDKRRSRKRSGSRKGRKGKSRSRSRSKGKRSRSRRSRR